MKPEDVHKILKDAKTKIALKQNEKFESAEYHIFLSLDSKKGGDAVHYFEYDPQKKVLKEMNVALVPKLCYFLARTNNHPLIKDIKDNLS